MPSFIAADGVQLYFEDQGQGLPILALAGLTRNLRDFDHVAPHLSKFRFIRMDYRGRGRSDWADPATYTLEQEARDALALLDHLNLQATAILGTSRGGLIGVGLAAATPDRVLGLCLNDVGPVIGADGLAKIAAYVGIAPFQRTLAEAAQARAKLWTDFEGVPETRWLAEVTNQFEETEAGLELRYDPALREGFLAAIEAPPQLWHFFEAAAQKPLALIRGANSDLLTKETADKMSARAPGMIRADIPGRGHVPFLDEPEALSVIQAWIEALS